jgi:hypothetical protein
MADNKKNTLNTPQSTKPFENRVPPKNPAFGTQPFKKPNFGGPKFNTSFRTQNRGGK